MWPTLFRLRFWSLASIGAFLAIGIWPRSAPFLFTPIPIALMALFAYRLFRISAEQRTLRRDLA